MNQKDKKLLGLLNKERDGEMYQVMMYRKLSGEWRDDIVFRSESVADCREYVFKAFEDFKKSLPAAHMFITTYKEKYYLYYFRFRYYTNSDGTIQPEEEEDE